MKWGFHQIDSSLSLETADKTFSSYMPSVQILQKPCKNKALVSEKCTHGIKFWGLRGLCFQDTPLVTKVKLESCAVLAIFWDRFSLQFADFPFLSIWFSVFIKNTRSFWNLASDVVFQFFLQPYNYMGSGFYSIWAINYYTSPLILNSCENAKVAAVSSLFAITC